MIKVKNILLPTDFSKLSFTSAKYAVEFAEQYGAKIHLLHVLEKKPPILAIRSLDLSEEKIMKTLEEDASASLQKALQKIKKSTNAEIVPVLMKGVDYEEIIKYAESNKIDLIIIATHGRTGILHTLLGSVAEKVIRHAKCPIFVTKPKESEK